LFCILYIASSNHFSFFVWLLKKKNDYYLDNEQKIGKKMEIVVELDEIFHLSFSFHMISFLSKKLGNDFILHKSTTTKSSSFLIQYKSIKYIYMCISFPSYLQGSHQLCETSIFTKRGLEYYRKRFSLYSLNDIYLEVLFFFYHHIVLKDIINFTFRKHKTLKKLCFYQLCSFDMKHIRTHYQLSW